MIRGAVTGAVVIVAALSALGSSAACAQTVSPPPAALAADPAREAAAQRVVAKLLPPGTYRRMMRDVFPSMMEEMMASMGGMTAADFGAPDKDGKTFAEAMKERDPAYRERMAIMSRIMGEEFAPVMDKIEPGVRAALGRAFARRFTLIQLTDLEAFLATPSGTAFGAEFMITFMDPDMMKEMGVMMPELMKVMPRMMERFQEETAHLPPEPRSETDENVSDIPDPA